MILRKKNKERLKGHRNKKKIKVKEKDHKGFSKRRPPTKWSVTFEAFFFSRRVQLNILLRKIGSLFEERIKVHMLNTSYNGRHLFPFGRRFLKVMTLVKDLSVAHVNVFTKCKCKCTNYINRIVL